MADTKPDTTRPVKMSDSAKSALTYNMRRWSGWDRASVKFASVRSDGEPVVFGFTEMEPGKEFTINVDNLLLNPNRVLKNITPFRLRQEAVVTGTMLHEAAHARHTRWFPGTYGNAVPMLHAEGQPFAVGSGPVQVHEVADLTLSLAKTMEEARAEGIMAAQVNEVGAKGLAWTMRVSAIHNLPFTEVNVDPDQQVLDVLGSWAVRAGRQIAASHQIVAAGKPAPKMPDWVDEFNQLLGKVVHTHIVAAKMGDEDYMPFDEPSAEPEASRIVTTLYEMLTAGEEASAPGSTFMVDKAKRVLDLLFPPDKQDEMEMQAGCQDEQDPGESDEQESGEGEAPDEDDDAGDDGSDGDGADDADPDDTGGESDDDGQDGEGNTEPEDEGSGTDPGAGDSGSDDSDQAGKPGDGKPQPSEADLNKQADLQAELEDLEAAAAKDTKDEGEAEVKNPTESGDDAEQGEQKDSIESNSAPKDEQRGEPGGISTVKTDSLGRTLSFRKVEPEDREMQKGAEKFLRNLIDPSEGSKLQVTDSPAATVDGAALAAWKAGGQTADPRFFRRVRRSAQPAPPVKIAVLVDRSGSMDVLSEPSSLLSWALASAAIDLRNFAGRGIQVESTLIHWGSNARVIQPNGAMLPGIFEGRCAEGTAAMDEALDLVAQQLPGFFDPSPTPVNRLLVQFTDWELAGYNLNEIASKIATGMHHGVNMLSVVPASYNWRRTKLDDIMSAIDQAGIDLKGQSTVLRFNPSQPAKVWDQAATLLSEER